MNQLISSVSASSLTIISVSGNYYVQILYQDGVDAERVELQLPGCAMLCPLDQLIHNSQSMAVKSQQEFESLCIKDEKPWRKDFWLSNPLFCVCVLLVVALLGASWQKGGFGTDQPNRKLS